MNGSGIHATYLANWWDIHDAFRSTVWCPNFTRVLKHFFANNKLSHSLMCHFFSWHAQILFQADVFLKRALFLQKLNLFQSSRNYFLNCGKKMTQAFVNFKVDTSELLLRSRHWISIFFFLRKWDSQVFWVYYQLFPIYCKV